MLFTRDLRLRDHPALSAAIARSDEIVPAFVFDDAFVARRDVGPNRWQFLLDSLGSLDRSLRERGSRLVVRRGQWVDEVVRLVESIGADAVFVSDDYSASARRRLGDLQQAAAERGFSVEVHEGVTVVPPKQLRTRSGGDYKVFTPYYRAWLSAPWRSRCAIPDQIATPSTVESGAMPRLSELTDGRLSPSLARGGEDAALAALRDWSPGLSGYDAVHNDLSAGATSRVSAYLHFGCLSALEVAALLRDREGAAPFIRQLCWRDFFHQVLDVDPRWSWRDVRPRGDEWDQDDQMFAAWAQGRTGYPVVDAGMRQLSAEGFMHNRARMIVASFLTKDLYQDWRRGAAHFATLLADADVACNQLNWQWVAGTGNDPNAFRVFNATLQGRRFDPDGDYIRRYVPELAGVAADDIHDPPPFVRRDTGYPEPIVDHREALALYRARRRSAAASEVNRPRPTA
ncbi:MAG TPA: deoxyribodipyrimidine photo-lyase [Acidimicrobiales bacterium]|nr:deoxyribodipyrimidine photo-lyase [Acidimicrobiales bacterium]